MRIARKPSASGRGVAGREAPGAVKRALAEPGAPLERARLAPVAERGFDFSRIAVTPPAVGAGAPLILDDPKSSAEREAESVATGPRASVAPPAPDFSAVRLHTGPIAARAAASIAAEAFTVGHDIVLGDQYAAGSRAGDQLLAHELTHVAQNQRAGAAPRVQRRSFFEKVAIFFGLSEGKFDDKELAEYLEAVTKAGKIEDHYDSDNKARAVVRRWMAGAGKFQLTADQMVLMIREMDTGYVGSEDQNGILDLLTNAQNGDLRHIFGSGGIDPKALESDFSSGRKQRLISFYETRFRGGRAALYGGAVEPIGLGPAPGAPVFPWDFSFFRSKLEDPLYLDEELAAELSRFSDAERDRAIKDLSGYRTLLQRTVTEVVDKIAREPDVDKKKSLRGARRDLERKRQRVDTVMQAAFRDVVKTEAPPALLGKTHLPAAPEKAEIAKALVPDVRRNAAGVALPFERQIVGEPKKYDDKVRDLMPTMVQSYWDSMVKNREPAQHADPTKVHKLDEFDSIANQAKAATDAVFGAYKTGPAFRSDRPPPIGRGKLHDLFADETRWNATHSLPARRQKAKALVFYFFQSDDDIEAINRAHNANPRFEPPPPNAEAALLDGIATAWVASPAHVTKLNEIDRNWDASADQLTHDVNLQIFKKPTTPEDRRFLWDMYQTLVHEYLHTLAHPLYVAFSSSFGDQSLQANTLDEGVDSLLDEVVWQDARGHVAEPAVRANVEGPVYSALPFDPALVPQVYNRRYASFTQAVKLVNVVGIRNLYAAYFLGKVDLIKP